MSVGYRREMSLLRNCISDTAGPQPGGRLSLLQEESAQSIRNTHAEKQASLVKNLTAQAYWLLFNIRR